MKRTDPTVSLLERGADGKPARSYTPAHMTNLRALFDRIVEERDFERRMRDVIATQPFRSDE